MRPVRDRADSWITITLLIAVRVGRRGAGGSAFLAQLPAMDVGIPPLVSDDGNPDGSSDIRTGEARALDTSPNRSVQCGHFQPLCAGGTARPPH